MNLSQVAILLTKWVKCPNINKNGLKVEISQDYKEFKIISSD